VDGCDVLVQWTESVGDWCVVVFGFIGVTDLWGMFCFWWCRFLSWFIGIWVGVLVWVVVVRVLVRVFA